MANSVTWPNGKKLAVSVTIMFETWSEGHAPNYSVQTTHLKRYFFCARSKMSWYFFSPVPNTTS
jgi:hypothetical protein